MIRTRAALVLSMLAFLIGAASAQEVPPLPQPRPDPAPGLTGILDEAAALEPLETVIVSRDGAVIAQRTYDGHSVSAPTNIKSASKTIISALVGIAIDKGVLEGVDQPIAPLLADALPETPDPRIEEITIGNLLSMQAGLERTSGPNYGTWVASGNWVRWALDQPFAADPGTEMLYSTGNTHLLSAILTRETGQSTLALAREWLGPLDDFAISDWEQDPQGIYLGGNQMAMTPLSLLAFGELYRRGGETADGTRVISPDWIEASWTAHTHSDLAGDDYGYTWFLQTMAGEQVNYAWGYGGQMLYIVPDLALTVVMTSDPLTPSAGTGHRDALHDLMTDIIATLKDTREDADAAAVS